MPRCKYVVALAVVAAGLVQMGFAQFIEKENLLARHFPTKERYLANVVALRFGSNLIYHNGPVIPTAFVVPIFWGPTWSGSDRGVATSLTDFIDGNGSTDLGYGETHEFNVITQYYETGPVYITESHLGLNSGALYDSSTPPTNVTDADVQAEVLKMTNNSPRTDTVYEVFLPASSYSSDGSYTSCGGPHLTYCAITATSATVHMTSSTPLCRIRAVEDVRAPDSAPRRTLSTLSRTRPVRQ